MWYHASLGSWRLIAPAFCRVIVVGQLLQMRLRLVEVVAGGRVAVQKNACAFFFTGHNVWTLTVIRVQGFFQGIN